ncbi:MAG: YicC family protein [Pseudomonadota bacterium]|nr:YicC family protein [Pseudomonadota bacterium]
MTGFARTEGHLRNLSWAWEVKSVNGRALEIRCRLPPGLEVLDPQVRAAAQARFKRGSLYVNLEMRRAADAETITINQATLAKLVAMSGELRRKHRLAASSPEGLLALRGVLEMTQAEDDSKTVVARNAALLADLDLAFADLVRMRRVEGKKLRTIVLAHLGRIENLATAARNSPARAPEIIRKRLVGQVERLLETGASLDRNRLHQEAVLLASRSDIEEELDRIFAHIGAARGLLESPEPAGRKFDFLAQEFNREANTLCSKAIDHSLTEIGLELKTVIDQMREQVQNLE